MFRFIEKRIKAFTYSDIISKLIIAVIAVSFCETAFSQYNFNTADYFNSISFGSYMLYVALLFTLLLFSLPEKYNGYVIIPLVTALLMKTNYQDRGVHFALISAAVAGGFVFYFGKNLKLPNINKKITVALCITAAAFLAFLVGSITIV